MAATRCASVVSRATTTAPPPTSVASAVASSVTVRRSGLRSSSWRSAAGRPASTSSTISAISG